MYCDKCSTENNDNASYCGSCGNSLTKGTPQAIETIPKATVYDSESKDDPIFKLLEKLAIFISWILGSIFIFAALIFLIDGISTFNGNKLLFLGIPFAVFSILLFPPLARWIEHRYDHKLNFFYRLLVFIVLLILWALIIPQSYLDEMNEDSLQPIEPVSPVPTEPPIQAVAPTQAPTTASTQTPPSTVDYDSVALEMTFAEFDNIFGDDSSLTELQKDDLFESTYKGRIVVWDGYVERVYEGWTGDYCLRVKTRSPNQFSEDFKVCYDGEMFKDRLLTLQEGKHIMVTGTIENFKDLSPSYYVEGVGLV